MISKHMHFGGEFKSSFKNDAKWFELYSDMIMEIPIDSPTPYGKYVKVNAWVDAYHSENWLACFSHTGALVLLNMAPILWHSKQKMTIKLSTFGSEVVLMRMWL